jgi:phosphate-selective porin
VTAATSAAVALRGGPGRDARLAGMRVHSAHLRLASLILPVALASGTAFAQEEQGWTVGPGAQLRRPGTELRLTGYIQEDFRSFHDYEDERGLRPTTLGEEWVLRRLRMGAEAKWKRISLELSADPHDDVEHLKDLYADIKITKALHVRGGNMKVPVSAEWLTSAAKTDFVERSLASDTLAPGRDWGVTITGEPAKSLGYQFGVFAGDGRTDESRSETTLAGRVEVTPAKGLLFGVSGSRGEVHADAQDAEDPIARGISFRAPSGFRLYERHFVDGTRSRIGADARLQRGPFGIKLEALQMTQERHGQGSVFDDLPTEVSRGWSASATWLVTGGRKTRTIDVEHPINHGGLGAVELGARYDDIDVDDDGPDGGFAASGSRARNIRPVGGRTFTGGLSWWPVAFVRFVANAVVEEYDDALLAPVPGRTGRYVTLLCRLQFAVP